MIELIKGNRRSDTAETVVVERWCCFRWWNCGVKELIVINACKCCIHPDCLLVDLCEKTKFRTLPFVFVSCFCISVASYRTRLSESHFQNDRFSIFFICGRASSD